MAAAERKGEVLPMLERWVRTNSFSTYIEGVNAMGELLAEGFALPGLSLTRWRGDGVGDHLVWRTPAWDRMPKERQLLIGHHDTVFPPGTFEVWELAGERLRGPGVLDMKGGLVAIRTALAALADVGLLADIPLAVVSVGDEEIGSEHSRPMLEALCKGAKAALVFEAGRMDDTIVTQRKGTGNMRVKVQGKAAHAGNNIADGINAIWALARFIDIAQRQTNVASGITLNVGLVSGGTSANTVPAAAECVLDFRYVRARDGEDLVAELTRAARAIEAESGAAFSLEGGIRRAPLERSDASMAVYERYVAAAREAGLGGGECPLVGGGSDANTVSAVGVPAIDGLGPRGKGFHTHQEYIEVPTLFMRIEALIRYLLRDLPPSALQ